MPEDKGSLRVVRERLGRIFHHTYQNGVCPDEVSGFVTRDVECSACRYMIKLESIPQVLELIESYFEEEGN